MMLILQTGIKPFTRMAGVASLIVLLAGCGFQLAGTGPLPAPMTSTFLQFSAPNSAFSDSLRSALQLRGSELVNSSGDAKAVLVVSDDDTGQRVLSVTARNIPREYEVYYSVTVTLIVDGQSVLDAETLIATRSYTYDERQVLGKSGEERILRESLADDLVRRVMRRIESVATQVAVPVT